MVQNGIGMLLCCKGLYLQSSLVQVLHLSSSQIACSINWTAFYKGWFGFILLKMLILLLGKESHKSRKVLWEGRRLGWELYILLLLVEQSLPHILAVSPPHYIAFIQYSKRHVHFNSAFLFHSDTLCSSEMEVSILSKKLRVGSRVGGVTETVWLWQRERRAGVGSHQTSVVAPPALV